MASSFCYVFGVTKQVRLERIVRRLPVTWRARQIHTHVALRCSWRTPPVNQYRTCWLGQGPTTNSPTARDQASPCSHQCLGRRRSLVLTLLDRRRPTRRQAQYHGWSRRGPTAQPQQSEAHTSEL